MSGVRTLWLALAFLVPAYLALALLAAWELRPAARARRRLAELRTGRDEPPDAGRPDRRPERGGAPLERLRAWLAQAGEAGLRRARGGDARRQAPDRAARRLRQAGLRLRPGEFAALQGVGALAGAGAGAALLPPVAGAVAGMLAGWWLPELWLSTRIRARRQAFDAQLPDALALAANALRSGYSFLQAADVVARELPDPIATEFAQVVRETRVNIALEDALANLLDRMESRDLDLVVTAVLIQLQLGGNLAEILETIADTIRDRVRIQGQVRTLTAQGRLSGWIVGSLPLAIATLLLGLNPDYILTLIRHPLGWAMLATAAAGQLLGALAIRRIVRVEV